MKHKVKIHVPVEKKGLFGIKKTVIEIRTIEVYEKTYKKMKQQRTISLETNIGRKI